MGCLCPCQLQAKQRALHQQGLLLAGANWQLILVYIQRFGKAEPSAISHCVRCSSCSSWQQKRWVPAVTMVSIRSNKPVSTQMSLGLSVPPPFKWPYSTLSCGRPDLAQALSLWTQKSHLIPISKSRGENSIISYYPLVPVQTLLCMRYGQITKQQLLH